MFWTNILGIATKSKESVTPNNAVLLTNFTINNVSKNNYSISSSKLALIADRFSFIETKVLTSPKIIE